MPKADGAAEHESKEQARGSWLPFLAIALAYACAALLVDPRGEFPLNDDWSYTRSAFRWGREGRMAVDEWSAPNLVGQALYGGWVVRILGPSFTALRISTILLSFGLACLLWAAFRRLGAKRPLSAILVLCLLANPVAFSLSFTFMTEIPFLFLTGLAFYCWIRQAEGRSGFWLLAAGAAMGHAFLIRQTAALFIAAFGAVLIAGAARDGPGRALRRLGIWIAGWLPFVAGYAIWARTASGQAPAAMRKFELLRFISQEQILGNSWGGLFYLAFFLLPLACLPAVGHSQSSSAAARIRSILITLPWLAFSVAGVAWFRVSFSRGPYLPGAAYHRQMPYLLNILYDSGVGPLTLDPTYYGPSPTPTYPLLWQFLTWATAIALVRLGTSLAGRMALFRWKEEGWARLSTLGAALLALAASLVFEVVFSHLQEGGLFDRHLLTPLLPLLMVCAILLGPGPAPTGRHHRAASAAAWTLAALILAFSVAATRDYLQWNRARWDLGRNLLAQGISPLNMSGGFEFNAWHNYDAFRARGNISKVYYWWYDGLDYLIAMEPQEGYRISDRRNWYSWVHRRQFPIFLLRKDSSP